MPKKRANGEGSIYLRKDGRWGYSYTVNGNQVNRAAKTQAEAARRLQEARTKILAGTYTDPSKITVEGWLNLWLTEYAAPAVRKSTLASYKSVVIIISPPRWAGSDCRPSARIRCRASSINKSKQAVHPPA